MTSYGDESEDDLTEDVEGTSNIGRFVDSPMPVDPAGRLVQVEAQLAEVERALMRLDDGSYGRCEVCERQIDDALLAGDPTGSRCAGHAETL